jgi:anti-sigma factor RsiW
MRHITDGELHAYLDGALGHLPEGRGDEVRNHLKECSVCRERLRDEEEVRAQAQDLLAGAGLEEVPLPSFEKLRARAAAAEDSETREGAPPRRRGPLMGFPLAWAATVVLALGVGWMGGEIWRSVPQARSRAPETLYELRQNVTDSDSSPVVEARYDEEAGAGAGFDAPPETGADALSGGVAAEPTGPVEGGRPEGVLHPTDPESVPAVTGGRGAPGEPSEEREKARAQEIQALGARMEAVVPAPSAALVSPELPAAREALADEADVLYRGRTASEETSMAVPGLDLLGVEWEEWTPGERALYIRQLLPMGDTLELRYLGLFMGSDPETANTLLTQGRAPEEASEGPLSPKVMEASLPPGWNQVVMRWGRGWLVARAPLSVEGLRGILRALH